MQGDFRVNRTVFATLLFVLSVVSPFPRAFAQSPGASDTLFQQIQAMDTELFNAYNHCDLATLSSLVADDLEFYHDKTGLAVGRQVFLDAIKNNICGKVQRELVPGTLEVYPIAHYGAVEIGTHRFHHPGQDDNVGEAKFIHLWQNKDGKWKVTRVISYDHEAAKK
jgi:ketosteroid isomerase-like protein